MTTFAEYLQAQMDERGWRQSDLARAAGINRAYISEYLRKGSIPKRQNLEKIAHGLGVSVREVEQAAEAAPHRGVFELSPDRQADAETLTRSQVALISEMIRHLAEGNRQYTYRKHGAIYREPDLPLNHKREAADEEVASDDDSTPMCQAAGSAATEDPDDYELVADDSLHQGDYGQIGPDDIEHST